MKHKSMVYFTCGPISEDFVYLYFSELSDHYLLPVSDRVPVIVYDHDPSSIIAYSLRYITRI